MTDPGPPEAPVLVSMVGGECSGKSTLAVTLADELGAVHVIEQLRIFVDQHGRPPARGEQRAVMQAQIAAESVAREAALSAGAGYVIGDPAALMTAIYSIAYFGDSSLVPDAVEHQRQHGMTIWCGIDLPWVADGVQRDGPQARSRVHEIIAQVVQDYKLDVLKVNGSVESRVRQVRQRLSGHA